MTTTKNTDRRSEKAVESRYVTYSVKIDEKLGIKIMKFHVIGKKNNKTPDADREIQTLRLVNNARNSINFVFGIIRLHLGWDFSVCIAI